MYFIRIIPPGSVTTPNSYPAQPVYNPQAFAQQPVVRTEKNNRAFIEWILSVLVCACGISGVALGIASIVVVNNAYGIIGAAGIWVPSQIKDGPSPVFALIMAVFALLFGAAATVLGIVLGNKSASHGKPRGKAVTIGTAFGIAAVIVCIPALSVTSCTVCSHNSIKDYVNNMITKAFSFYS